MELQQIGIKKLLLIAIAIGWSLTVFAEEIIYAESIKHNVNLLDSGFIKVSVSAPKDQKGFVAFALNKTIPNYYLNDISNHTITDFKVHFKDNLLKNIS